MIDKEKIARAAGFFNGEGTTCVARRRGRVEGVRVEVAQSGDRDVLDEFREVVGVGKVYGPYNGRPNEKERYLYVTQSYNEVRTILSLLWNGLSRTKRAQAIDAFKKLGASRQETV